MFNTQKQYVQAVNYEKVNIIKIPHFEKIWALYGSFYLVFEMVCLQMFKSDSIILMQNMRDLRPPYVKMAPKYTMSYLVIYSYLLQTPIVFTMSTWK